MKANRILGVALPAVLWITAGLSLFVGSFSKFALVQHEFSHAFSSSVKAKFAAKSAAEYAMRALETDQRVREYPPIEYQFSFDQLSVSSVMVNSAGLIDPNYCSDEILVKFLQKELNFEQQDISQVLEYRKQRKAPAYPTIGAFIRSLPRELDPVHQEATRRIMSIFSGSSGVNYFVSPEYVLRAITDRTDQSIISFVDARRKSKELADINLIGSAFHQSVQSGIYKLEINVATPSGNIFRYEYWLGINSKRPAFMRIIYSEEV